MGHNAMRRMIGGSFAALLALGGSSQAAPPLAPLRLIDFGAVGTADDSLVLQRALDAAERQGRPLLFPAGTTINVHGTVYVGNVTLQAAGARIAVLLDGAFVQRGTALRRSEGAILTKAAPGAGYGYAPVHFAFDTLRIDVTRTSDASGPRAGLLLENVAALRGTELVGTAHSAGRMEVDPFDFYGGVQGVRLVRMTARLDHPRAPGGIWIRNFFPERATANILIGTLDVAGATRDELVSIFNSGDPRADVRDITIDRFVARPNGSAGMALSIFRNAGGYDPAAMRKIAIRKIDIDVGAINFVKMSGGFAVKVQQCAPQIGAVKLRYSGTWQSAVPYIFGIRFVPGAGQGPLTIGAVTVDLIARNIVPARSAAVLYGSIATPQLVVRGSGSGFRHLAFDAADVGGLDVTTKGFSTDAFAGTRRVRGRLNGRTVRINR